MRYINLDELEVDDEWLTKAKAASAAARAKATKAERSEFINSKSNLWSEIKPSLEALSNKKCWYCESYEKRSDRAVDHHRPKNNVRDCIPPFEGYWWLAFDYKNYRLSCTFCNSIRKDRVTGEIGGKGDYFPVFSEASRVQPEGVDFRHEGPLLLDPCNPLDVTYLDYRDDGRVVPRFKKSDKPTAFRRADQSITDYHLNETELKEARQALYQKIVKKIDRGDLYFENAMDGNVQSDIALEDTLIELAELCHKNSEFSAFAKAIIAGFRGKSRLWLEGIDFLIN